MKKILIALAVALSCVGVAHAERSFAVAPHAKHQQECSSCHVAYPPGLLPAASWERIVGHLNKHFGTDASLDAATTADIGAWLQAHAAREGRLAQEPQQDRISRAGWFVRQHDEVSANTWKRASIGSPANCSACHAEAARGNFNEHQVRIPK
ncbi:cytochrome C [Rhodoferax lacus]|uniref:Cytochrome C n=1 Tax=Rhodoferax lacus TaxID=2184758 RepID=A0A3E1R7L8_9BURK|nr:cytochrome C [Rhodoferax lacus]RFO95359.1 cytochrome C [Rhodoferax lacus]